MAELLLQWRPKFDGDDVSSAIMHALERYSIALEGSGEMGLLTCLRSLEQKIEGRIRSI